MRTRSQLRAVAVDVEVDIPTASHSDVQSVNLTAKSTPIVEPAALSEIKNAIKETTPGMEAGLKRSSSLIPAYAINSGAVEDLQLESLLGTPYSCEVKTSTQNTLKASDLPVVDLSKEKMPGNITKPAPPALHAAEKENAIMSIRKVKKEIKALLASKKAARTAIASNNEPTQEAVCKSTAAEQSDNAAAELLAALDALDITEDTTVGETEGPLRGMPRPVGAHLRFDDDGSVQESPRQRVFLRGMPEPVGRHTRFN